MGEIRLELLEFISNHPKKQSNTMMNRRGFRGGFDGTEWKCLKCNQINFSRNQDCYRCGVPKRQAEADANRAKLAILQKQKALKLVAALNAKMQMKDADESKAEVADAEVVP